MLTNRFFSIFAVAAMLGLAACNGDDTEEGAEATTADTTTVQGMDTVSAPAVVPTTDTVVTTTTTETDTIRGEAGDTVVADTVRRP